MSIEVSQLYEFGSFFLDPAKRLLKNQGELVPLNSKAFDLLLVLVEEGGRVVEKDELMKRLWPDSFVEEGNLSVQVSALRKALGETPNDHQYIVTIPGRGYRFAETVRAVGNGREFVVEEDDRSRKKRSWLNRWMGLAIALVLAGGLAVWFPLSPGRKAPVPPRVIPFTSFPGKEVDPTFSPDGNQLAFAWDGENGDNFDIYVQLIGTGSPLQLTHDPGADLSPVWSPDGRSIAFVRQSDAGSGIFLIPALGGHERPLANSLVDRAGVPGPYLAWSPDGKTLVIVDKSLSHEPYSLFLLSIETGELKRLTSPPDRRLGEDSRPAVSPDGKTVAFSRGVNCGANDVYLVPFTGGEPKRLTFDNRPINGLAWTADGQEIIFSSGGSGLCRIGISAGKPVQLAGFGENIGSLSVSRLRNRLACARRVSDENIWRLDGLSTDYKRGQPGKLLIASTRDDGSPQYSPDGKKILFVSNRSGTWEFWVSDSEGRNAFPLASDGKVGAANWSPDGQRIAFDSADQGTFQIYVMSAEGGVPRRLTTESSNHVMPSWSRDGRWIYLGSDQSGDWQVWKIPSAGGQAVQVTQKGGFPALESPDGKFLYYSKKQTSTAPGFWRVPAEGGKEVPVIELLKEPLPGYWAVSDKGIYFVEKSTLPDPAVLKFMSFTTGRIKEITQLEKPPVGGAGLSVSPDGRWVLYQDEDLSSDIMLVENFK